MIPEPILIRSVFAAAKASEATVSTKGESGGTGDGGSWGSISTTCSPVQIDSKPTPSAVCSRRVIESGLSKAPMFSPK